MSRTERDRPDQTAERLGPRSELEPVVERAALVRFEMAEADPAQPRGIDELRHPVAKVGEHPPVAGVEQDRLRIAHEEVVELESPPWNRQSNSEDVR
jgi:hypothetical protein